MTMVIDNQGRHYGGGITYDHMYPNMHTTPQFSDPWSHQTSTSSSSFPALSKTDGARSGISMPYSHMPPVTGSMAQGSAYSSTGFSGTDLLSYAQDMPRPNYGEQAYSSPAATSASYAPSYSSLSYAQSLHQQQQQQQQQQHRKLSDTVESSRAANASFGELDASRGMLALSHQNLQDLTPRNIYEARAQRASTDSYGFPQASSAHSSISNESGRGYAYYAPSSVGSVTDSATDYSSAASDGGYESMAASRTLPRPNQLLGPPMGPPAPQSMMGQFSSKMAANTQKKHKCKVCDKRFTRPSSLQTHMYSHTGEKPFACDVEGCGRHFSVVSNLRRHKKVHKGDSLSSASHSDIEE
ncbi:uncharacterized protein Z520_05176 [Fonsecaea multimorphosa CBS 102226]|uniref:C2H2-type domain-containing protein n=1 Tax=Fonsecaea multimorphosa CBS 102226 TaxID=1442371 RepID=A0A0D2HA03_9EURO|nr:uncharacterized protein Z520_05176 [Fonsecaea multimorphosa CBS 102226]KIX98715.1 hypothetical protein Z520_05176 [Fonsecaea multimorphosa CBS 102226]OAL32944.1 hypothetical protein AYO22_00029 [Fonsecaea multimorphosa]